jgi:hypothetical protein
VLERLASSGGRRRRRPSKWMVRVQPDVPHPLSQRNMSSAWPLARRWLRLSEEDGLRRGRERRGQEADQAGVRVLAYFATAVLGRRGGVLTNSTLTPTKRSVTARTTMYGMRSKRLRVYSQAESRNREHPSVTFPNRSPRSSRFPGPGPAAMKSTRAEANSWGIEPA